MARFRPLIVITPGDPAGIGPEIVWKTLRSGYLHSAADFVCVGARAPFDALKAPVIETSLDELRTGARVRRKPGRGPFVWLLPAPDSAGKKFLPGFQAGWSIETAVRLIQAGIGHALVTGPIHKERLQRGGYKYPGHTEFLAELCGIPEVTMMLANKTLRISLVTTHIGLGEVPRALTPRGIRRAVDHTVSSLRHWWGIPRPRIAIAALNPHAGEGGLFGTEEKRIITPEVRRLQSVYGRRCILEGPLPADTLFAKHLLAPKQERYDAVICMYHDQGLIPVKLLDFPRTVNITLGLPIIRTSVDHGVGFDIVGTGQADPSSLQSAISLAIHLSGSRS